MPVKRDRVRKCMDIQVWASHRLWEVMVKAPVFTSDRLMGMNILNAQVLQV